MNIKRIAKAAGLTAMLLVAVTLLGVSASTKWSPVITGATGTRTTYPHFVTGTVAATTSTGVVTLSNAAVYTSTATYQCMAANLTATAGGVKVTKTSGTSVSFIAGGATDTMSYLCVGN